MYGHPLEYDPVPTVNPTGATNARENISTSPAMFGGALAQATGELGKGLESSGNAAINVADQQAQLDAETHAAELHTWQSDQVTDQQEQFLQLRGKAAVDALPAFKQKIDGIREQARGQASNPYTARLVDDQGRRLTDIAYSQMARHAADQSTQWETETAADSAASSGGRAAIAATTTPGDVKLSENPSLTTELDKSDAAARHVAQLKGLDGDVEAARNRGRNVAQIIKSTVADGSQASLQRAIEFFHSQYDNIDPASRATIEQSLKGMAATYDGQKTADMYMGRTAGLPAGYAQRTFEIESGGNPNAQSGSYRGLAQFSPELETRYGINDANRADPAAQARALAQENAENHDALAHALGHEPTPADYYLAHQQGIGGAVAHLSQPNLPAWQNMASTVEGREKGAAWAKQAIWGNMTPEMRAQFPGGVETVTSGDFVRMWSQRFYGAPIQAQGTIAGNGTQGPGAVSVGLGGVDRLQMAQVYNEKNKAVVLQKITNDPYLLDHPQAMNAALTYTNKIFEAQSANYADLERQLRAEAQEKKIVSDNAESGYMHQIYAPAANAPPLNVKTIVDDPRLSNTSKDRLIKLIGAPGDKDQKTYGAGFVQALQMVHAAPGTPGRITDVDQLYPRVGKDLTFAGFQKLRGELSLKGTPEGEAEATMKKQFLVNARAQITGTDLGMGIKDMHGDELYLKFLAQAMPAYDAGRREGKTPVQLLNPDSPDYVGKIIKGYVRPPAEWQKDISMDQPGAGAANSTFDIKSVKTLPELVAAFHAGHVSRDQARAMALQNGWVVQRPKVPVSQ